MIATPKETVPKNMPMGAPSSVVPSRVAGDQERYGAVEHRNSTHAASA